MERARRYLINALILSGCTLLMRTVSVAFNAFCVNRVGEEGMGLFSLVMSVYTFAVTLATSGVNLAATRLTALYFGKGEGRSVRSAMRRCLLYSAFFGALASLLLFLFADFVSVNFLMEPRAKMSVRALSISLLPLSLCSAFSGYFAAVRRVYKNAISQIVEQMIKIFACAFLLSLFVPRGVEYACLALVLGGAISETASFIMQLFAYIRDKRKLTGNGERVPMRAVLDISLPVALSAYVRSGLVTLEHILIPIGLTAFGDPRALATYGVISAVALPTVMYPSAFVGAFSSLVIPEVTEFHSAENKREVSYVTSRAFYVTLFFSILCAGIFCTFPGDICTAIYGDAEAAVYLRALAPLMPVMFLDTVTDSILKGLGKQFYTMCVNIADAGLSALLVWLLVPRIGIWGYILVIYISECVNTVFSIWKLIALVDFRPQLYKWLFGPLLGAVGAANLSRFVFSVLALPLSGFVVVLEFLIFILFYLLICRAIGALSREDVQWIKNIFFKGSNSSSHKRKNMIKLKAR